MKKIFKRVMALILVAVMTFTAVPLSGFEAKASGLTGYSAGAAAKWGRDHINDVWSPLLGYGIWENGGDCANYVSQCLYMGGLDMTGAWHSNGCMRYYAALSDGVFIRAQQLHDYLVSIGGQSIRNPSADQLSLGDVLFFKRSGAARCTHSAIVIDFENGQPVIGYHSILNKAGVYEIGRTTDIDLDFMRENTYLVKLNGSICTAQKSRDFDVYIANKSTGLYSSAGGYGFIRNVIGSDYIHVYSTQYANGSTWGYTFCRGYWGWVKIADCNYQTHVSTPEVNHKFGGWYVAKPATCLTSGYEQRDCTVCGFSQQRTITGGHLVKEHATCLTPGFCSICGAAVEEALGHDFGDWSFITEPTCTEGGVRTHICKRCGFEQQEEVPPLGHDDIHVSTPPSCTDIGTAMYECQRCGRTIANYINSENTVTDWTPEVIEGLKPVETKIQYSYRDKSFTSSYGTGIDGWTQYSYEWVQSGSGDAQYVNSWPSGWHTDDWHYQNFRVGPFSPYETEIAKREVVNTHIGYLNAHWCRGNDNSSSSKNTLISQYYTAEFWKFHAFGSYDNKATSITENAYKYDDGYYCNTTYWWHANLQTPYYSSRYTDYNKLFHYYKWSDWSGWTDEEISASDTREVQTRTVYKYNLAALGHDFSVVDSQKDPTCTEPGYIGKSCSRCGAISPDAEIIPSGHELYDEISERGWHKISEENGVITWRRDCQRFCGYYEEKQEKEKGECVFELKEIIESTCEEEGKIISVCKYHNEEKIEIIKAKGHEPDNNWITEYGSTCANGGKDGKEICYCVRHDNGKTCSKVFERPIPAPAHIAVKDPPVPPTCTESGYKEGSHCDVCKETLIERVVDPALGHEPDNNWIVDEEPGCDKDGKEICYCVRHDDGVTCDKIFDRPIPGIPATYKEIKRVESSCAECGYIEYTCINCEGTENEHGYTEPLPLDPNGHAEGVWKTLQEAQICEIPGIEVSECPLCGEMLDKKEIPPQYEKHNMVKEVIKSSCTTSGITNEYCTQCGLTLDPVDDDPLGHDLGDWVVEKEATCTEHGEKRQYCQRDGCSYYITEPIAPIGHDYKVSQVIAPLCEEIGKTVYVCQNDSSHTFEGDFVPALGHEPDGNWIVTKEPDCTNKGTEQCDCVRHDDGVTCDTVFMRDIEIDPDAHDWGDWFVDANPNCVDKGIEKRICNINNEHIQTKETVTDPDNHDMGEWYEVTKATCTEKGLEKRDCNRCDYSEERETAIDPDNHYAETFYTVDEKADCENDGKKSHHCERCDKSLDEVVISKRNHVYDNGVETKAPTCTEDGVKTFTCTNKETNEYKACTHSYTEVIPATDHAWDDGVIDPDSTCKVHGTKTYTCQNDASHTKTEEVPLDENNHVGDTYIKDNKDAKCTEDGYTGDIYCSDCDKKLSDGNVIPALCHDMGEWYEVTKATCTEKGIEKRDCNRCDYYEERETAINPDNHYAETFNTVDEKADCENDGKKSHHCERCDKSLDEVVISKRNHAYDDGVETTAPTCTEDGVKTFTCTNEETNEYKVCTHSYTEVIPATGHDWGEWKIIPGKEPTIYEKGRERCICNNDSSHIQERDVDKLESRVAYFIVADENGDFEYEGKKYTLVDTVRFALGTTVIINPDVPEMEGYYGYWENYTISDKDLYIEAKYELKSGDNQSDLVSDKDVVYKDGVATITLSAFAETLNAKVPMGATPYDIVLVLDQSSSMEKEFGSDKTASNYNNSRIKVLKDVAISFIQTVYDSSVENNVDHRMAIVGFSGTEYSYKNTGLLTPSGTVKTFDKLTDKDYASAFVDVRVQKNILDASINNMVIKTGTSADYGMQMARQVLANNRNSEREKLVLFITDGEPADVQGRNYWPFSKPIANDTIDYANQIKQDYDATIYSVGVAAGADPDDETKDLNIYLHNVSSNYPDAKSMTEKGKSSPMKNYFLTAEDKDAVSKAFESIVAQKITNTISFTKVNFYDTISEYFTLTTENENALRQSVKEKYGVTDRDIIITRNADGTTTVRINNLIPKPVFDENNVQTGYGVTVDFDVTANEKTLDGGTFLTNNENAGIEHDGKTVIDFKIPEGEVISSGRAIVEFRIGDEVYAIREVNIGDNVIVPETDVADWIITEGATITSDYTVFNAEYTTETNTVEWIIGDEKITQTYHTGEIIRIPEIDVPENKIFTGWSTAVPYRMPAYALSFTALFKSHEHNFSEQNKQGDCVSGIVHIFTCDCGYSYTTQDSPAKHSYTANVHLVNNESVATMTCSVCGAAESSVINYKAQYNQFGSAKVVDLTLHDNKGISVQPDGYIYIKIAEDQKVLSNAKTGKLVVTRVNADNSTDKIPYLKNGSADSVGYYVEGSYIILKLDHFSYYVMTIPEEDGQIPSFGKIECAFNGHNYESVITAPTCTTEGYTTHTCTSCGDVYTDAETGITEHIYENNICIHCGEVKEINCSHACHKNGFIGFIWKIFNFIFRIFGIESERFCDCGADHW